MRYAMPSVRRGASSDWPPVTRASAAQLPSYMVEPAWLYRASRFNEPARWFGAWSSGSASRSSGLAGRAHLWRVETAVVRLLRRLVAMSAIQQVRAKISTERDGEKRGLS